MTTGCGAGVARAVRDGEVDGSNPSTPTHMEKLSGYSIWITADGKNQKLLEETVATLAKNHGCPLFEPHMTLLGPIKEEKEEVIKKTKKLAKTRNSFELEVGEIDYSSTYFQCVFARVKTNQHLIKLRMNAQEIFEINSYFMPHISLFYGDVPPHLRAEIAKEVDLPKIKFTAKKLIITPALEDPDKWEHLAEIDL